MAATSSSSYAVMTSLESSPDELIAQMTSLTSSDHLEALIILARRHSVNSPDPRWLHVEALALIFLNQIEPALSLLGRLSSPHHREGDTWVLRGIAYRKSNDSYQALKAYRMANSLEPGRADILYNLANILADDNPHEAIHVYSQSLHIDPFNSSCWFNYGLACLNACEPKRAIRAFTIGLTIDPLNDDALCNLGIALVDVASVEAAERAFKQALTVDDHNLEASSNLGNVMMSKCQPDAALPYLIKGASSDAKPKLNLGLCQLLLGEFDSGWENYESRLESIKPPLSGPRLTSFDQVDNGRSRLVVWAEQGLGDSIMFARYLLLLDARKIDWCFYCPDVLVKLFQNRLNISGSIAPLKTLKTECIDFQIPLLSLPRMFKTTLATVPGIVPYLGSSANVPKVLCLPQAPGGLSVGLVWASDPTNRNMYKHKSISLDLLMPRLIDLVQLDLIDIHSLQVGSDRSQLLPWLSSGRITDWSSHLIDFQATAHVVQQLDLVISVDTAVAHLAGALGIPTWLLVPANADFRWLRHKTESPWYPGSVRIFRQATPGDWQSVISDLHESLDRLFLLKFRDMVSSEIAL